jgi:hypothetical protein
MHGFRLLKALFCIVLLSCGKPLPEFSGFEKESWVADKNGCNRSRAGSISVIEKEKDKLLSLSEMDIVDVLGRPDQNELYKRNQKFYYYYLTPAPQCPQATDSVSRKLVIRFNAMGLAKEVTIE